MINKNVKKQLMYLSGEDFYLFCYSIFIILDTLGCSGGKSFRDYRKLAFLINIINNDKLVYIIANSKEKSLNTYDKEYLFDSYSSGLMRRSEILKLIFTLEKKGFVSLVRGRKSAEIDISLDKDAIPKSFFDSKVFLSEYKKVSILQKSFRGLSSLTLVTMLQKIYADNGVKTWAI